jgi:hypothetical protein
MVNDQEIDLLILKRLADHGNLRGARGVEDRIPFLRENQTHQITHDRFVIDDEYGRHSFTNNVESRSRRQVNGSPCFDDGSIIIFEF